MLLDALKQHQAHRAVYVVAAKQDEVDWIRKLAVLIYTDLGIDPSSVWRNDLLRFGLKRRRDVLIRPSFRRQSERRFLLGEDS